MFLFMLVSCVPTLLSIEKYDICIMIVILHFGLVLLLRELFLYRTLILYFSSLNNCIRSSI